MVWFGWAIPSFNMYSNAYDLSLTYTNEIFTKVCFRLGVGILYSCHQKRVIRQSSHLTRAIYQSIQIVSSLCHVKKRL